MEPEILNKRPEGMTYEEYKKIRKLQQMAIKAWLKGRTVWKSKIAKNIKGNTFKGKVKDIK